jgi:hypothetical protein
VKQRRNENLVRGVRDRNTTKTKHNNKEEKQKEERDKHGKRNSKDRQKKDAEKIKKPRVTYKPEVRQK